MNQEHSAPEPREPFVVSVFNEDDGETAKIPAEGHTKLRAVIQRMYADFHLTHKPGDRLRCAADGEDVFPFEELTIDEYLERGHCPALKWNFAKETGGADATLPTAC